MRLKAVVMLTLGLFACKGQQKDRSDIVNPYPSQTTADVIYSVDDLNRYPNVGLLPLTEKERNDWEALLRHLDDIQKDEHDAKQAIYTFINDATVEKTGKDLYYFNTQPRIDETGRYLIIPGYHDAMKR